MTSRRLQRRLCGLSLRVASKAMRPWAAAMVREVEEIDDPRIALEWAADCLRICAAERLRPLAVVARAALAVGCLWIAWRMTMQVLPQIANGAHITGVRAAWIAAAALFALTSVLVALKRSAATWIAAAATAITAGAFAFAMSIVPFDILTPEQLAAVAREQAAACGQIAAMSAAALASAWLTRRASPSFSLH